MGAVYEAVDLRLDTVVALKETLFTEERLRKQFEREARLLARLHHQALPRVSDHFTESEGAFLVMQYIPGEDLFEMQGRRGSGFSQADVLQWADQLCDALDYLHTQDPQIIHRDIKPQNLKLTARGQIVLLDFGLAKGSGGQMSVVTTSASIFGYTPNYAPLEQVQGLGTDPRSDIYALAATLYHLMTNVKPPDALSRASAIVNGLEDPLAPADSVSPSVSRSVAQVLQTAMSQKRDDRYESAGTMREALRSASTGALGEMPTVLTSAGAATRADAVAPAAGTQMVGQRTQGGAGTKSRLCWLMKQRKFVASLLRRLPRRAIRFAKLARNVVGRRCRASDDRRWRGWIFHLSRTEVGRRGNTAGGNSSAVSRSGAGHDDIGGRRSSRRAKERKSESRR